MRFSAVVLTVLMAFSVAGRAAIREATQCDPAAPAFSDRLVAPGERIGPLLLGGKISDVEKLCGPGTLAIAGGPRKSQLFSLQTWNAIGLWVQFDSMTGNVVWISVEANGSNSWTEYATADGVRLGTRQQDLVSVMGPPERTVTGGGSTSFYYDRRGIRFTLLDTGPLAGKVGAMRVVWPAVPRGDTIAVPGKRISSVEVGMAVEQALALLGGGYSKGEAAPGVHVYYWPHLGLSFVERSGRVISARAGSQVPADAPGIRYSTMDGLGRGSTAAQIKAVLGEPTRTDTSPLGEHWWIFRPRGIAFGLDNDEKVRLVDVFPPE